MKHSTFRKLLTQVHEKMVSLTESKGEEYKGVQDNQFGNFERTAQDTGLSREQVWLVFFNKHFDALRTYVRDMATGVERKRSESIVGRIDDAILYLILLRGMVIQNEGGGIEAFGVLSQEGLFDPIAVPCVWCVTGEIRFEHPGPHAISKCAGCGREAVMTEISRTLEGERSVKVEPYRASHRMSQS